jgi:hypothetical protein
VRKEFPGHGVFVGAVEAFRPPLYTVRYEDDDVEDVREEEVQRILQPPVPTHAAADLSPLAEPTTPPTPLPDDSGASTAPVTALSAAAPQVVETGRAARGGRQEPPLLPMSPTADPTPGASFVGRHVVKEFPGYGTFSGFVEASRAPFWTVRYEDGDVEDLQQADLERILVPVSVGDNGSEGRPGLAPARKTAPTTLPSPLTSSSSPSSSSPKPPPSPSLEPCPAGPLGTPALEDAASADTAAVASGSSASPGRLKALREIFEQRDGPQSGREGPKSPRSGRRGTVS